MKALFLVGGSGTRLRPLTDHLPKPMIPVMGRPLLERRMEKLRECGINEIVLNPCYQAEKIVDYFGSGWSRGWKIHYEPEQQALGTGGTIRNTARYFDDTFFVFNADIMTDIPLQDMLAYHKRQKADITIAATYVDDPTAYGVLEYNANGFVTRFTEKPKPEEVRSHYINAGIYIMEPHVLKDFPQTTPLSVEREVFPLFLEKGYRIAIFRDDSYWMDLGTPQKYVQTHLDAMAGACEIVENDFSLRPVYTDCGVKLDDTVQVTGPAYIGRGVIIEENVHIGENVVIGDGAHIGSNSKLNNCIVWPGVKLPSHTLLRNNIVAKTENGLKFYSYRELHIEPVQKRKVSQYAQSQ